MFQKVRKVACSVRVPPHADKGIRVIVTDLLMGRPQYDFTMAATPGTDAGFTVYGLPGARLMVAVQGIDPNSNFGGPCFKQFNLDGDANPANAADPVNLATFWYNQQATELKG